MVLEITEEKRKYLLRKLRSIKLLRRQGDITGEALMDIEALIDEVKTWY